MSPTSALGAVSRLAPASISGAALAVSLATVPGIVGAASSIFATSSPDRVDATVHPPGYRGETGEYEVGVCIVPGSPFAAEMERPTRNAVATWNGLRPTSANVRRNLVSAVDFESTLLHELGHCQGLAHVNLGSQPGVSGSRTNYVLARKGPNGAFDTASGPDGIIGTADDARGDDVNVFRFFTATNDPYALPETVDATTYSRDASLLPPGDLFPTSSDHTVSTAPGSRARWSEAVMNQGTLFGEVQRTLAHDDVAGMRHARTGLDHLANTGDDYSTRLIYRGIVAGGPAEGCDIALKMDAQETGFAVCRVSGRFLDAEPNISITRAQSFFNPTIAWDFNPDPPCTASKPMPQDRWVLFSVPCLVGTPDGGTVGDVIADDLGVAGHKRLWTVFAYEYVDLADGSREGAYRELELDDPLETGVGYWVITTEAGRTVDVAGEYPSQPDAVLGAKRAVDGTSAPGWNAAGNPFRNSAPWEETLVVTADGRTLTFAESDPTLPGAAAPARGDTVCTANPTRAGCTVARIGFRWDPTADPDEGAYVELGPDGGALGAFDGVWVFAARDGAKLRVRMTGTERAAR